MSTDTASDPPRHFPATYAQGRAAFLEAAAAAGAHIVSHEHPGASAPDGQALFTDTARLGADVPQMLVVISSGTHGVEGFCGSGCQTGMLREGLFSKLPDGVGVLLVHALNPYGFAHLRRVNEDNIDLNRNFVDHEAGAWPDSSAYEAVHDLVAPPDLGERPDHYRAAAMDWIGTHGMPRFQAAVSGGQYTRPDGLFYGGRAASWSNRTWTWIVEHEMAPAQVVRLIDIHTGLGPRGHGEKLGMGPPDALARARMIWGDDVTDLHGGDSVSAVVSGDVSTPLFRVLAAKGIEVAGIGLEYGTTDTVTVLGALQMDNWLCLHGDPAAAQGVAIKQGLRDAFYVDRDDWKTSVFEQACSAASRALL